MAHEDLTREQHVEGSSDRAFGLVFAGAFLLIALAPLRHGHAPRWWAFGVAAVFALIALLNPMLLTPLNRLWIKLGVLLGRVVSPIALGILFYGILTPIGAVIRLTGKDPLRLKLDPNADSYWIARKPPGPAPDSMINQF
jgi:Saxitoxin biosynthesis operon protein SxtJ